MTAAEYARIAGEMTHESDAALEQIAIGAINMHRILTAQGTGHRAYLDALDATAGAAIREAKERGLEVTV